MAFCRKTKTCRNLLLLPNSLRTSFSYMLKDIPNLKHGYSPQRHRLINLAEEQIMLWEKQCK